MSLSDAALETQNAEAPDVFSALQKTVRGRMPALDGLRGIAILWVLWHNGVWAAHWEAHGALASVLILSAGVGWVGVQLFFVLSGFLITGILLDEKSSPHLFRNFYVRRILRIFPLYYGTLLLFFVALPALGVNPVLDIKESTPQIWYWLFLANWSIPTIGGPGTLSHFWSLAVEEQFYLIWPFTVAFLNNRKLAYLCVALIVGALVIRIILIAHGLMYAEWRAYEFTFARWDALAFGALVALMVRRREWHALLERWIIPVVVATSSYVVIFIIVEHNYASVGNGIAAINQTVVALLFAAALHLGLAPRAALSRLWVGFLENSALRKVGKYSYAIYVFHYPLLMFLKLHLIQYTTSLSASYPLLVTPLQVMAVGVVSYFLAVCSWYVIEQPCLRLKRFFISRQAAADALASR